MSYKMCRKILLSVIIPLFNKDGYIESALESVANQQVDGIEILIIDDGSTDGGAERVERWIAGNPAAYRVQPRLIRQANAGVAAARNVGLLEARGRLIAFLDADDRYCSEFFLAILQLEKKYPQAGLLCTAYWRCFENNRKTPWVRADMHLDESCIVDSFHDWWSRGAFTNTNSIVLHRAVVLKHGLQFAVGESHGEDQDMWFRTAEVTPVAFVNSALTEYRMDVAGSAMQSARFVTLLPAYLELEHRLKAGTIPNRLRHGARQLISVHRINVAVARLDQGNVSGAVALLFAPGASLRLVYWLRTLARCAFMYLRRIDKSSTKIPGDLHRKE